MFQPFHPASELPKRSRFVVVADASKKRAAELRAYQKRCRELDQSTRSLQDFQSRDRPAFEQWIETEFASQIKEFNESRATVHELMELIELVRELTRRLGISSRSAYEQVQAARADGTLASLFPPLDFAEPSRDEDEADAPKTQAHSPSDEPVSAPKDEMPAAAYLKAVYRQLVRNLHPDTTEPTPEQQVLWHAVQDAYQWRDLQRLERLLKKITAGVAATLDVASLPIFHIMDLRRDVEKRLRDIKMQLKTAREDPAWNFGVVKTDKKRIAALRTLLWNDIADDVRSVRAERRKLERQVAAWEMAPGKERRR